MSLLVGCHPKNTTNSIYNTIREGVNAGSNVVQLFLKNPHKSNIKIKLTIQDYSRIQKLKYEQLYVHASYLINLCRKPPPSNQNMWAINSLVEDMTHLSKLNGNAVVVHVGKSVGLPLSKALQNMKNSIEYVLQVSPKDVDLCLETPAGSGTEVLVKLKQLAIFYKKIKYKNFKICVDTCHIFVAGNPIHTLKGIQTYFKQFDKLIGLQNLKYIHLNDSVYKFNSRKDKHAELTEGYIFKNIDILKFLVQFSKIHKIPLILETHQNYEDQIHLLKSLTQIGGGDVFSILQEMAKIHQYLGDSNRTKAYINALWLLKDKDLTDTTSLQKIKGIHKIAFKIKEILDKGTLIELENLKKNKKVQILYKLNSVMGIGPKFALELYKKGIRHVKDIKPDILNNIQKLGLKYYNDLNSKIPRKEMDKWNLIFKKKLKGVNFETCGSYRRGESESHDIDLLIVSSENIKDLLKKKLGQYIVEEITSGLSKLSFLVKINKVRRLDVLIVSEESYPTALLYMTGSKAFTIMMRTKAKQMGYTLNEYGLYMRNTKMKVGNERDIFRLLDVGYLSPKMRGI